MQNFIKRLPWGIELILVLTIGLGRFIYHSTLYAKAIVADVYNPSSYEVTDLGNYSIIIYEVVAFCLIAGFLKSRGWSYKDFNLEFTWKLIGVAFLLYFLQNIVVNTTVDIMDFSEVIKKDSLKDIGGTSSANWISIFLILTINSIYEEFILIGYLFKRLEKYSPALIIGLSLLLRLSYHTYQGWISLVSIIPLALVFGYYYYKYKKLWPIIIAHAISNLFSFLFMHYDLQKLFQN